MQTILNKDTGDTIGFPDEMSEDQIFKALNPTDRALTQKPAQESWYDTTISPALKMAEVDISAPSFVHVDAIKMNEDIQKYGVIKKTPNFFENIGMHFKTGINQVEMGKVGSEMWNAAESPDFWDKVKAIDAKRPQDAYTPQFDLKNDPIGALENVASGVAEMAPYMTKSALMAAGLGAVGAAGGSVLPGVGTAIGAKVGQTVGVFASALETEGGGLYVDLRKQGVSHDVARAVAIPTGMAIAGVEVLTFETIKRSFPGAQKGLREAVTKIVIEDPAMRQRLTKVALKFTGESLEQVGQEDLQELFQIGGEIAAKLGEQKKSGKEMKFATIPELVERMKQVTIESAKTMPLLQLPGAVTTASSEFQLAQKIQQQKIGLSPDQEGELHSALIEEQTSQINEGLTRIGELRAQEQLTFDQRYELDALTQEFGHIDPSNKSMISDVAELRAEESMSESRALIETKNAIAQHIMLKARNVDPSVAVRTAEEMLMNESEKVLEERKVNVDDPQNTERIYQEIKDQLVDTDTDPQVADDFARFWEKISIAAAKTQGITPTEWYLRNKVRIQQTDGKQLPQLGALAQGKDLETPAFKNWFGNSKIVNKDGSPMVMYHWSRSQEDFSKFGDFPKGKYGDILTYGAHFGTKEQAHGLRDLLGLDGAQGERIYPVYLSIKNPKRVQDGGEWATVIKQAKAEGYDGIVYANEFEGDGDSYIAFYQDQIKSSIGNNGNYDPKNPNILFQSDELTEEQKLNYEADKIVGIQEADQWLNWEPERTKGNVLKGAPEGVTSRNLHVMRGLLRKLTREGVAGRFWYRDTSRTVLKLVQNNVVDADKFIQLLAIYSPNTALGPNTMAAVRVWNQYKNGAKPEGIHAATEDRDGKARTVLFESGKWDGRKTNSFYLNIMHEILATSTPEEVAQLKLDKSLLEAISKPVTVDLWMLRAFGYENHSATDDVGTGKYSFVENEIRRITAELNQGLDKDQKWLPHEVQAAIWVSIKGRYEIPSVKEKTNAQSRKKGYTVKVKDEIGNVGYVRSKNPDAVRAHDNLWRDNALAAEPQELVTQLNDSKISFADVLNKMTFRITAEAIPSKIVAPDLVKADQAIKSDFTDRALGIVTGKNGEDLVAKAVGAQLTSFEYGSGGYDSQIADNVIVGITPTKKAGPDYDHKIPKMYQKIWQYVFKQDAVPYFRPDPRASFEKEFIVRNKETQKTFRRFDAQAEAEAAAKEKGEGYEVVGSKFAHGFHLELAAPLSPEQRLEFLNDLDAKLGNGGGHTTLGDGSIVITNFRDDTTNLPFMDDVVFEEKLEDFLHEHKDKYGIKQTGRFGSEGNYGFHDWSSDAEGKALADYIASEGSPDLLKRVDDWKLQFEALTKQYEGAELKQRAAELEKSRELQSAAFRSENSVENLFQEKSARPRGWVELSKDPEVATKLFLTPRANASTLFHEAAHIWFNDFARFIKEGKPSKSALRDWKILKNWLNIKSDQVGLTEAQQEKFARGFEAYLREGRAPSVSLRNIFKRLRKWLTDIYRDVKQLNVNIDDSVRGVFDRMLEAEDNPTEKVAKSKELTEKVIDNIVNSIVSNTESQKAKPEVKQVTVDDDGEPAKAPAKKEKTVLGVQREGVSQKPVLKTGGEERVSRAFERIRDRYADILTEQKISYDKVTLTEDTARAIAFVEQFPDKARRIALGIDPVPSGVTETAVSIAYAESMRKSGNLAEFVRAEKARSLRQTRRGQEIAAERGRMDDNSPSFFIEAVLKAKMDMASKRLFIDAGTVLNTRDKISTNRISKVISQESAKIKKDVASKGFNITDAQKLIEGLIC